MQAFSFFLIMFIVSNIIYFLFKNHINKEIKFLVGFLVMVMISLVTNHSLSTHSVAVFIKILVFSGFYFLVVGVHFFIFNYLKITKYSEYIMVSFGLNIVVLLIFSYFLKLF